MSTQINLEISKNKQRLQKILQFLGEGALFFMTCASLAAVIFIFLFIAKDALPFFKDHSLSEFFGSSRWYPAGEPAEFGALANFYGTFMVTFGASLIAIPTGLCAAICLSDVLPFKVRQIVKPVIEILAAIPSVAYGFFALVILAPMMQDYGGMMLRISTWIFTIPVVLMFCYLMHGFLSGPEKSVSQRKLSWVLPIVVGFFAITIIYFIGEEAGKIVITSGTNALNVSLILGIMALPTIVSVAEDSLQACGNELREGSYALGATRAETLVKVVLPAASGGVIAAIILGIMRAVGETMVVWMASGNTAQIPKPWYNLLSPVRTLTASIAGDMGEAARHTSRYHVLFAMALSLLLITFLMNVISQAVINRQRKKMGK